MRPHPPHYRTLRNQGHRRYDLLSYGLANETPPDTSKPVPAPVLHSSQFSRLLSRPMFCDFMNQCAVLLRDLRE